MKAVVVIFLLDFFLVCLFSSFLGFFVMTYSYCGFKGLKARCVLSARPKRYIYMKMKPNLVCVVEY